MKEYTDIQELIEDQKSGKIKKGESVKLTETDDQKPKEKPKPLAPKEFQEKLNVFYQKIIFWAIYVIIGVFALIFLVAVFKTFR